MEVAVLESSPNTTDDSGEFRQRVRATLTRLSRTGRLPVLPAVATAGLTIARNPDGNIRDLAKVLQTDVGLTAAILRVANSPAYGRRREARRLQDAIMTLGMRQTCELMVTICARQLYVAQGGDAEVMWSHSLAVAVAAEELARKTRRVPPEAAFLPGLLHDVGRIAFQMADPKSFKAMHERVVAGEEEREDLEREYYEFDHAQVGGILSEDWGLTPEQSDGIRWHHDPECAEAGRGFAAVLNAADSLAYMVGLGMYPTPPPDVSLAAVGVPPEEEEACTARLREAFEEQKRLFG